MDAYLEVWQHGRPELVLLRGDRYAAGSSVTNDLVVDDPTVSRLHAVLERFASGWTVRDVGSRNGTYVNGQRVFAERALRPGDELRLGNALVVFRVEGQTAQGTITQSAEPPPELTRRERDVLHALCRPLASGNVLAEPARVAEIAAALVLTESAVRKHLLHLYDKFGLHEHARRRGALVNEAVRRGAVTIADLR
jgi:hypothetical protein